MTVTIVGRSRASQTRYNHRVDGYVLYYLSDPVKPVNESEGCYTGRLFISTSFITPKIGDRFSICL
jgi:hypothetical protein